MSSNSDQDATKSMLDRARGHEIDGDRLRKFIARAANLPEQALTIVLSDIQPKAGASSGTKLFDILGTEHAGPYVLRFDTGGTFFTQYDLAAQFAIMQALYAAGYPAPHALWFDDAGEVCGRQALVMRRILAPAPSVIPYDEGQLVDADPAVRRAMVLNAVDLLAQLHRIAPDTLALPELRAGASTDSFIDRELAWVLREVDAAMAAFAPGERLDAARGFRDNLAETAAFLRQRQPRDRAAQPVHGDPNISNFMFDGAQPLALLDWEAAHLGFGETDIAYFLGIIDHYHQRRDRTAGVPSAQDIVAHYAAAAGGLRNWGFCQLMGEWRVAALTLMATSRFDETFRETETQFWINAQVRLGRARNVVDDRETIISD